MLGLLCACSSETAATDTTTSGGDGAPVCMSVSQETPVDPDDYPACRPFELVLEVEKRGSLGDRIFYSDELLVESATATELVLTNDDGMLSIRHKAVAGALLPRVGDTVFLDGQPGDLDWHFVVRGLDGRLWYEGGDAMVDLDSGAHRVIYFDDPHGGVCRSAPDVLRIPSAVSVETDNGPVILRECDSADVVIDGRMHRVDVPFARKANSPEVFDLLNIAGVQLVPIE